MSWGAYAMLEDGIFAVTRINGGDQNLSKVFRKAETRVRNLCKRRTDLEYYQSVDGMLRSGALSCAECREFLAEALDIVPKDCEISLLELMIADQRAPWEEILERTQEKHLWAFYSSRVLVRTTIKLNMGIYFT